MPESLAAFIVFLAGLVVGFVGGILGAALMMRPEAKGELEAKPDSSTMARNL